MFFFQTPLFTFRLMQQIYLQRPTKSPVCPPLIGDLSPPGCNKTFIVDIDGKIPCKTLSDCPMSWDWWDDGQQAHLQIVVSDSATSAPLEVDILLRVLMKMTT